MPVTDSEIDAWASRLSITSAPLVRASLGTALRYFEMWMPTLDEETKLGFLRGMDLHKPVKVTRLPAGTGLAAFRQAGESPFKLFYTKVGTSIENVGVNPATRSFVRFVVRSDVEALESRATAIADTWSVAGQRYVADGGGIQYVIPASSAFLIRDQR